MVNYSDFLFLFSFLDSCTPTVCEASSEGKEDYMNQGFLIVQLLVFILLSSSMLCDNVAAVSSMMARIHFMGEGIIRYHLASHRHRSGLGLQ